MLSYNHYPRNDRKRTLAASENNHYVKSTKLKQGQQIFGKITIHLRKCLKFFDSFKLDSPDCWLPPARRHTSRPFIKPVHGIRVGADPDKWRLLRILCRISGIVGSFPRPGPYIKRIGDPLLLQELRRSCCEGWN